MKPATSLSKQEIAHLTQQLRRDWPELDHYETGVFNLAINRVQAIAEAEGVAAITPARLEGLREIIEEYILPFAEVARIRERITARATPATQP